MGGDTETDDPENFWDPNWICGSAFQPSYPMVKAIADSGEFQGHAGAGALPPFLVGRLPGPFPGLVLFVKLDAAWQGYAIEDGGGTGYLLCARGRVGDCFLDVEPGRSGAGIFRS